MNKPVRIPVAVDGGPEANRSAPVIVSASRATDVPAFFADWFVNRLEAGHCEWVNPFNAHQRTIVSFEKTRAVVFWSKNPRPLLRQLDRVDALGIGYYVQFTLNDYQAESLEPGVPGLGYGLDTFNALAARLGPERVIWRFDPILLSPSLSVPVVLSRIDALAERLNGMTRKLVVSFADIDGYRKVQRNLAQSGAGYREPTPAEMTMIAAGLGDVARRHRLTVATCAEGLDLARYGIEHNRCIDDELLARCYPHDRALMDHLGRSQTDLFGTGVPARKDPGQRKRCGCIVSKDIGAYDTCPHLCAYCYANTSRKAVLAKFERRDAQSPLMIPPA